MLRALQSLPGSLGRFLPCRIGANHCRLRSVGWEQCGHGLSSGPLESSHAGVLDDLSLPSSCVGFKGRHGCADENESTGVGQTSDPGASCHVREIPNTTPIELKPDVT